MLQRPDNAAIRCGGLKIMFAVRTSGPFLSTPEEKGDSISIDEKSNHRRM